MTGRETAVEALVKGLRKAVADPETEWIDANIVRLLLDRYETAPARETSPSVDNAAGTGAP